MSRTKSKPDVVFISFVIFWVLLISAPAISFAESTDTPKKTVVKQQKKPGYQNTGYVLRVGEDEIVVDDHLIKFAKRMKYHGSGSGGLVSKTIKEGSYIGFNLNDKKEMTDIWIIKRPSKR